MSATVQVLLTGVRTQDFAGISVMPVAVGAPQEAETMTSGAGDKTSVVVADDTRQVWSITVKGGDVWCAFVAPGSPETAGGTATTLRRLLLAGSEHEFYPNVAGEKFVCRDA